MRHVLAVLVFCVAFYFISALVLANGKLSHEAFMWTILVVWLYGIPALLFLGVFYAIFRAHPLSILFLLIAAIGVMAIASYKLIPEPYAGLSKMVVVPTLFATFAHHLILLISNPNKGSQST